LSYYPSSYLLLFVCTRVWKWSGSLSHHSQGCNSPCGESLTLLHDAHICFYNLCIEVQSSQCSAYAKAILCPAWQRRRNTCRHMVSTTPRLLDIDVGSRLDRWEEKKRRRIIRRRRRRRRRIRIIRKISIIIRIIIRRIRTLIIIRIRIRIRRNSNNKKKNQTIEEKE